MKQSVALVLLVVLPLHLLGGCTAWRAQKGDLGKGLDRENPSTVRVTLKDSSTFILKQAYVADSLLIGSTEGEIQDDRQRTWVTSGERVELHLTDIDQLAIHETSPARTARLVFVVGALGITFYAAAKSAEGMFRF